MFFDPDLKLPSIEQLIFLDDLLFIFSQKRPNLICSSNNNIITEIGHIIMNHDTNSSNFIKNKVIIGKCFWVKTYKIND